MNGHSRGGQKHRCFYYWRDAQ